MGYELKAPTRAAASYPRTSAALSPNRGRWPLLAAGHVRVGCVRLARLGRVKTPRRSPPGGPAWYGPAGACRCGPGDARGWGARPGVDGPRLGRGEGCHARHKVGPVARIPDDAAPLDPPHHHAVLVRPWRACPPVAGRTPGLARRLCGGASSRGPRGMGGAYARGVGTSRQVE